MPNGFRHIMGTLVLWRLHGIGDPTFDELAIMYKLSPHSKAKNKDKAKLSYGWWNFEKWNCGGLSEGLVERKRSKEHLQFAAGGVSNQFCPERDLNFSDEGWDQLVVGVPSSNKKWKEKFCLVGENWQGSGENHGWDGFPVPKKFQQPFLSRLCGKLSQEHARNIFYILTAIPADKRSCSYLLHHERLEETEVLVGLLKDAQRRWDARAEFKVKATNAKRKRKQDLSEASLSAQASVTGASSAAEETLPTASSSPLPVMERLKPKAVIPSFENPSKPPVSSDNQQRHGGKRNVVTVPAGHHSKRGTSSTVEKEAQNKSRREDAAVWSTGGSQARRDNYGEGEYVQSPVAHFFPSPGGLQHFVIVFLPLYRLKLTSAFCSFFIRPFRY